MPNYEYTQPVDWAKEIHDQLYATNKLLLASTYPEYSVLRQRLLDEVEAFVMGERP